MRIEDRNKAIELRKQGKSYNEIRGIISNLSKGTLSVWLRDIDLTKEQQIALKKRAKTKCDKGRLKGAETNKNKRINSILKIKNEAKLEFSVLAKDPLFITGLVLYWAEGAKTQERFQFINSDYRIIKIMIDWLEKTCKIHRNEVKYRLYIHKVYAQEDCEKFWAEIIGVSEKNFKKSVYKPTPHKIKKNLKYKGCLRMEYGGVDFFRKVMGWQEALNEYLK